MAEDEVRRGATAAARLAEGEPLQEVLDVADPGEWLALDAGVRQVRRCRPDESVPKWEWKLEWDAPLPRDLMRAGESGLAVALCHRNGWIREAAVRRAAQHPGLLPLVVIRCADWVAPLRRYARQLLRDTLDVNNAADLAPLLLRVGRRDRGAFGVQLLEEVLQGAPQGRLAALFAAPDRGVRRFAYRLAVAEGRLGPVDLARTAARDEDNVVQDLCANATLTALAATADVDRNTYDDVLTPLLAARNPRTRSTGVTALRRAGRPQEAERFLNDRSAVVRACARYVVRQYGGDPTTWYRTRCTGADDAALLPGTVIGLAECGDRADAGLLRSLLAHPDGAVRAQAVAGLRAVDRSPATTTLLPLLDDPVPAVVREVTVALLPSAAELPADLLLDRTGPERPRHLRSAAFRLLDAHGGVMALRAAVGLLADPDVKLRVRAEHAVRRWRPAADERRGDPEVGRLLDRGRHLFSDRALRQLAWEAGLDG
ncbi:HEAT repeat domain-containing protein [Streptomyces niger]|uniref:HEAT repeat domain-containing protein n=1 Tax=Streptomyces niger TaxID=66373 RepID=UPI000A5C4488|nr:HEAT repeat domain-containing protein [Streptomyces niger]